MKRIFKITSYGSDRNPDGTLKGRLRVRVSSDIDGGSADADVVIAKDGTEVAITGTLSSHIVTQAARETGLTLAENDISIS